MYVLARHVGESIMISGIIEVKILNITGNIVRIGIDASRDISVERKEIRDQAVKEKD